MKHLTMEEQRLLVRTVKETKGAERDYVIIELLRNTGLRATEFCCLNVGDVRNKQRVHIQRENAKGKKGRTVPLNFKAQDLLRKWIAHKMSVLRESIEDDAPLFVTKGGRRLTRQDLTQSIVQKWCIRAGLTRTKNGKVVSLYSAHSLRHAFSQNAADRNGSMKGLKALQKTLGHKTISSTGIYFDASDSDMEDLANSVCMSPTRAAKMRETL